MIRSSTARGLAANPALGELAAAGGMATIVGRSRSAVYCAIGDFVIVLTQPGAPLLPNGLSLTAQSHGYGPYGTSLRLLRSGEELERWDPKIAVTSEQDGEALSRRGHAIVATLGTSACVRYPGFRLLLDALRVRDAELGQRAAAALVGRGPGLTPVGDDLLCATAIAVHALGPAFGWEKERYEWLAALVAQPLHQRTTALSATLLELSVEGMAMKPVHALLDTKPSDGLGWRRALHRVCQVGHSTGRAYVLGLGAAAAAMGQLLPAQDTSGIRCGRSPCKPSARRSVPDPFEFRGRR